MHAVRYQLRELLPASLLPYQMVWQPIYGYLLLLYNRQGETIGVKQSNKIQSIAAISSGS